MSALRSFVHALVGVVLIGGVGLPSSAIAGPLDPVPVTIKVIDPDGNPIVSATIRHPEEKVLHSVNHETGEWTESVLYLANGKEIVFLKDQTVILEISAVGYMSQSVRYLIRKRKNVIPVVLQPIPIDTTEDGMDPQINFRRDRPIE